MLLSVVGFSFVPLLLAGVAVENPFLFNGGWRLGFGVGLLIFLVFSYRSLFRNRGVWSLVWAGVWGPRRWIIGLAIISQFEYPIFAWSSRFVDVSVTTVLFETYHVFVILFAAWLFREESRYQGVGPGLVLLLIIVFVGFAFVISGQVGHFVGTANDISYSSLVPGVLLAILAAVVAALSAFNFRWGSELGGEMSRMAGIGYDRDSLDLFCVLMASLVANAIALPFNLFAGVIGGETISISNLGIGLLGGLVFNAMANVLWRKANLATNNLGVNAVAYITPIISLVWLFLFSQSEVPRVDYLVIGASAIVTANLLINFEAEIRWGFKALIVSLWACGGFVYLREGMFDFIGVDQWYWADSGHFESITLSATVFTLLLAFRVARLVSRTSEEDSRTFAVYRKLNMLSRRGIISPEVCVHILDIDRADNNSLAEKRAYSRVRALIDDVDPVPLNEADAQLLSDAESQLDALVRSKQVDIHLGEQFALWIFGGITIGLALFTLPSGTIEGWTRLVVDLFAMLISAVVIFLLFHIQDLQRERDQRKFEPSGRMGSSVRFLDTQLRTFDQWLSMIVGGAIVVTYSILLAYRWVG